ncbi:hypothetical protein SARC_02084 [Sphaeroforma arctica JP610]|uniref:EKC/KEOPS complex subunit CGI121 n=1 Tax=Sphaeroforma arctica JP610 TaxID=667725 RepID=A0A0L0GA06_9EUKA|nr:hypothetical protein SARC_02084 [Sphaeroforma arctica JP610]KNC85744.1 hypothetical protein SARC_02084 [Sphaeroforma arctica JP610]|eukprot:XP_014159646.1 hypothetical protein SARC_02084 [Sphaeroforma arctica JP610]
MTTETLSLGEAFSDRKLLHVLCVDVQNVDELLEKSKARENNEDDLTFPYALIDARIVVSPLQLYTAATCALQHETAGKLKTRRLHSEIVFCMSPSGNVNDSLIKCGITPDTTAFVLMAVDADEKAYNALLDTIQGRKLVVSAETLVDYAKYDHINSVYKLDKLNATFNGQDAISLQSDQSICNLAGMVVSKIACQDMV